MTRLPIDIDPTPAGAIVQVASEGTKNNIFHNIGYAVGRVFSKGKEVAQGVIQSDAVQGAQAQIGNATQQAIEWGNNNPQLRNAAILATTAAAVGGAIYVAKKNQKAQHTEPSLSRRTDWREYEQARSAARGQDSPSLS